MKPLSLLFVILIIALTTSYVVVDAFTRDDFPEDFLFGAASSAYQWEGAVDEDGRTPSVWDTFAHSHNRLSGNGDITSDGYHKYKEDVKLMAKMGLDSFRFSISWSRLIPNGRGLINPKGLLFYKNLIKELKSHGIEPQVPLYHYDHPQSLEDEYGGWLNRKIIEDFTAFADVCFREFGEDVKLWTTINEATIFAIGSYSQGISPPGRCSPNKFVNCSTGNSSTEPYIVGHNILLAHASASRLYKLKYKSKQRGSVGISIYAFGFSPYTNSKDDEIATQRAKTFFFGWLLKPLVYGDYPDEMKKTVGSRLPVFSKEESEQVKGSSEFVGMIHYTTFYVSNRPTPSFFPTNEGFFKDMGVYMISTGNSSFFVWEATPWGLEDILEYIKDNYNNPPIYILENGKPMNSNSTLQDTERIDYIEGYIGAVLNAIKNGSDTKGYFVWSMIDMYELLSGYTTNFGLYHVNFSDPGRKRTPKLSAAWYTGFLNGTIDVASQDIIQLESNSSGGSSSL
ncbi:PREDICTED: beta-glucosidase 10 [Camelina sativa]|uniref:Beta-glucosidase 10 n=1 Tax=Camelina sativa TaxID=90675 RepID=A0ABM0TYL3_CAMSA|nr:PREDICTED: beta-glucosidase 10 [Camelina sativa]